MLLRIGLLLICLCNAPAMSIDSNKSTCDIHEFCKDKSTDVARIFCISSVVYQNAPSGTKSLDRGVIVYENSQGWGNCVNGLYTLLPFAAMLGRRVVINIPYYRACFLPVQGSANWSPVSNNNERDSDVLHKDIEFALHGSGHTRLEGVKAWADRVSLGDLKYSAHNLHTYVNGPQLQVNSCIQKALPGNASCLEDRARAAVLPAVVHRPSPQLCKALSAIRKRLKLPELSPGTEPRPGAFGLRSPGIYLLALHFRGYPQGFEGIGDDPSVRTSQRDFGPFMDAAEIVAGAAAKVAACREQKLMIYFATDHARALRKTVEGRLMKYGRVVFGLREHEVGHVNPVYSAESLKEIARKREKCEEEEGPRQGGRELSFDSCHFMAKPSRSEEERSLHQIMGMAEWWILAQSHLLMSSGVSSFSDTASDVGLGSHGVMERFAYLSQSKNDSGAEFVRYRVRKDMEGDCREIYAVDREVAKKCPNHGHGTENGGR